MTSELKPERIESTLGWLRTIRQSPHAKTAQAALRELQQWRQECTPEKHHEGCDTCLGREEEFARLREALEEIAKGQGRFSRDPLTHASNTVADMKELAREALEGANDEPAD